MRPLHIFPQLVSSAPPRGGRMAALLLGGALAFAGCAENQQGQGGYSSTSGSGANATSADGQGQLAAARQGQGGRQGGEYGQVSVSAQNAKQEGDRTRYTMAYPTGDRASSVLLVEKVIPRQVRVGQPFEYEIKVTNITNAMLEGVRVQEMNPGFEITSSDPKPSAGGTVAGAGADADIDTDTEADADAGADAGADPDRAARDGVAEGAEGAEGAAEAAARAEAAEAAAEGAAATDATTAAGTASATERSTGGARARVSEGQGAIWPLGNLKPNESRTIRVSGVADQQGTAGSCLSVAYRPSLCTAVAVVQPELRVTKRAPERADICEEIVFEYTVTNAGTGTTDDVTVRERLPDGLTTEDGKNEVVLAAGKLDQGKSKQARVKIKAARPGTYAGRATATGAQGLQAQSGNTRTLITQPRLSVRVEGPEAEYIQRPIAYRATVTNEGDAPAQNAVLALNVPGGAQLVQANEAEGDRQTVRWNLGTIEPRQSKTVSFVLRTNKQASLNTAVSAEARCANAVQAAARTEILTIPALVLEVVDAADPIKVGENVTYRIRVTNQGTGPDSNIQISAELPPELQFVDAAGATRGQAQGQVVRFGAVPKLEPGQSVDWTLNAKARQKGDVRFEVQLESEMLTKPAYENEPTQLY